MSVDELSVNLNSQFAISESTHLKKSSADDVYPEKLETFFKFVDAADVQFGPHSGRQAIQGRLKVNELTKYLRINPMMAE